MAETVRPLILQLGQKITDRLGRKINENDPEYWGLNEIVTDEMAEVALKMEVRKPVTLSQLAKKTGKDELLEAVANFFISNKWKNCKL